MHTKAVVVSRGGCWVGGVFKDVVPGWQMTYPGEEFAWGTWG